MEQAVFTVEMGIVLGLVGITVVLFLTEWLRVDVVAMLIMVVLPLLGLVEGREAFAGLASNAVISIIAVIIMGRGLDHTGVVSQIMKPLMRLAGTSRPRIFVLVASTVAIISSFMQNVGAAALFLPAIRRMSRASGIAMPQLLMPIGFAAILGGTVTLVGSSPLIMLNDLIEPYGLAPYNLFSVVPVGLALVLTGIAYFLLGGTKLLPGGDVGDGESAENPLVYYPSLGGPYELVAPYEMDGKVRVLDLIEQCGVQVVGVALSSGRDVLLPPDRSMRIQPGAVLAVYCSEDALRCLMNDHGFSVRSRLKFFAERLSNDRAGVVEALVPPHSRFVGMTVADVRFRHNHLMAPLAVTRGSETKLSGFWDMVLRPGDSILMFGPWESFKSLRPTRELLFAQSLDHDVLHPELAWRAVASFGVATALVLMTDLALSVCLMTGAVGMIVSRVLTVDEAYRGVDWRTVFLLGGLIPLGLAMQSSGAAPWIAGVVLGVVGTPPPVLFIFLVGALSTVFTLVVSNVGAVVLLVPLAVDMAVQVGADPRMTALVVALAASNSFVLPTHQVNALYMGPGHYSSRDFVRAGVPLTVLFLVVLTAMTALFY